MIPCLAHSKEPNTLIVSGCGFIEAHLRGRCWQDRLGHARSAIPGSAYSRSDDPAEIEHCDRIYNRLAAQGIDVLYDDRQGPQAGEKLADADLIGIADHIVVSRKTLAADGVEWKARLSNESAVITLEKLHEILRPRVEIPDIVTS